MKYLSFGKQQYSIGYNDDKKIKPSFIYFTKMGTYKVLIKVNVCIFDKRRKMF